jgi:hypothetical protein
MSTSKSRKKRPVRTARTGSAGAVCPSYRRRGSGVGWCRGTVRPRLIGAHRSGSTVGRSGGVPTAAPRRTRHALRMADGLRHRDPGWHGFRGTPAAVRAFSRRADRGRKRVGCDFGSRACVTVGLQRQPPRYRATGRHIHPTHPSFGGAALPRLPSRPRFSWPATGGHLGPSCSRTIRALSGPTPRSDSGELGTIRSSCYDDPRYRQERCPTTRCSRRRCAARPSADGWADKNPSGTKSRTVRPNG